MLYIWKVLLSALKLFCSKFKLQIKCAERSFFLLLINIHIAVLPRGGGGEPTPFTPLKWGDFENTQSATCFHHLGQFITTEVFIKPLFILDQ